MKLLYPLILWLVTLPCLADISACQVDLKTSVATIALHGPVNAKTYRELTCQNLSRSPSLSAIRELTVDAIQLQDGRYGISTPQSHYFQRNPLQQTFSGTLPAEVKTVGAAIIYLLQGSSYRIAPPTRTEFDVMYTLLNLPVAEVQRAYEQVQLAEILQLLGGSAFQVMVDDVHRVIGYQLQAAYQKQLTPQDIQQAKQHWLKSILKQQGKGYAEE